MRLAGPLNLSVFLAEENIPSTGEEFKSEAMASVDKLSGPHDLTEETGPIAAIDGNALTMPRCEEEVQELLAPLAFPIRSLASTPSRSTQTNRIQQSWSPSLETPPHFPTFARDTSMSAYTTTPSRLSASHSTCRSPLLFGDETEDEEEDSGVAFDLVGNPGSAGESDGEEAFSALLNASQQMIDSNMQMSLQMGDLESVDVRIAGELENMFDVPTTSGAKLPCSRHFEGRQLPYSIANYNAGDKNRDKKSKLDILSMYVSGDSSSQADSLKGNSLYSTFGYPMEESSSAAETLLDTLKCEQLSDNPVGSAPVAFGFATAGGKPLSTPSANAIRNAKKILDDALDAAAGDQAAAPDSHGFQLASGRDLSALSTTDIVKARSVLQMDEPLADKVLPLPIAVGFRKATGDFVEAPSSAALQKARSLLDESLQVAGGPPRHTLPAGFGAASNREISESSAIALTKTPRLSEDAAANPFKKGNGLPALKASSEPTCSRSRASASPFTPKTPSNRLAKFDVGSSTPPTKRPVVPGNTPFKPHAPTPRAKTYTVTKDAELPKKRPVSTLFNMSLVHGRLTLKDSFGSAPERLSSEEYAMLQIADDIVCMTCAKAAEYRLPLGEGRWTIHEALSELLQRGSSAASIDVKWIKNHWRWIVWKICSLIRSFPFEYGRDALGKAEIVRQLCYRYEREINMGKSSLVKKILERDDVASRLMVLCVARIEDRASDSRLELTDNWYSVMAAIDRPLQRLLDQGRIFVGQKLQIFGAQLVGSDAVPALESLESGVELKISANSTRRAPWHARLGRMRAAAFYVSIRSIFPDGGIVACVEIVITRIYPPCVVVTDHNETKSVKTLCEYEKMMDVEATSNANNAVEPPTLFIKIKAMDARKAGNPALITIWRPTESLMEYLVEGSAYRVFALRASETSSPRQPDAINLTGTKSTVWRKIDVPAELSATRHFTLFENAGWLPANADADLCGVVISPLRSMQSDLQGLFLVDISNHVVCIKVPARFSALLPHFSLGDVAIFLDVAFVYYDRKYAFSVYLVTEQSGYRGRPLSDHEHLVVETLKAWLEDKKQANHFHQICNRIEELLK